jgi:hypothetical protein
MYLEKTKRLIIWNRGSNWQLRWSFRPTFLFVIFLLHNFIFYRNFVSLFMKFCSTQVLRRISSINRTFEQV